MPIGMMFRGYDTDILDVPSFENEPDFESVMAEYLDCEEWELDHSSGE